MFGDDPVLATISKADYIAAMQNNTLPDNYRRRTNVEIMTLLGGFIWPITFATNIKALLIPVEKPDGSLSTPPPPAETRDMIMSSLKDMAAALSSSPVDVPQEFTTTVESLIVDLEKEFPPM